MLKGRSITRRLITAVIVLEALAAVVLIAAVAAHEQRVQFTVFDTGLRANASALFGALQEADARDGSIVLDRATLSLPRQAVYSVVDGRGAVLGSQGSVPDLSTRPNTFVATEVQGVPFVFYTLMGDRIIDPGRPVAITHHVRILYGLPTQHVWHEVREAIEFVATTTAILLGATAALLMWLTRRLLDPIRALAIEAERIDTERWSFEAPPGSREFVEVKPLVVALERTIARIQQTFEQQKRFTSDAAHELKTDVAIAKSSFQLLRMNRRTVEEYEEGIDAGLEDVARLERTVMKMLNLARLEQARQGVAPVGDLREALHSAIAQCDRMAALREVRVEFTSDDSVLDVPLSDDDALLLCSNVLMNALQHSSRGGCVEVTASREGGNGCVTVRDHGPGVAEEDNGHLFEAFYRGDRSRSRETGGTGLGLSICEAICQRAGGGITISNHAEGGALVEFHLPIAARHRIAG